jgi:hypothetical protein
MGGALKSRILTLLVLGLMIGFSQIPLMTHQVQLDDEEAIHQADATLVLLIYQHGESETNGFIQAPSTHQFSSRTPAFLLRLERFKAIQPQK